MTCPHRLLLALAVLAGATPALAHHRQTPGVVRLIGSGNTVLPRLPTPGRTTLVASVQSGSGSRIFAISPWRTHAVETVVADTGDHANPVVSLGGRYVVFDSTSDPANLSLPGRQVVGMERQFPFGVSNDPKGASENPSIDGRGHRVAFESTTDLTGSGTPGVRQVFLWTAGGGLRQLSRGLGIARNATLSPKRFNLVAFQSSSHPDTGADTGIAQIWLGDADSGAVAPITAGDGPSTNPAMSNDGRIVAFESTADLGETQADTGTSQVYIYDTEAAVYARLTNEPGGCGLPSAYEVNEDWRIAYVCGGLPYFTMLHANVRFLVPTPAGGLTQGIMAGFGAHFLVLSTTADLIQGVGTTVGNRLYLVNLYKRGAIPMPGQVTWFPSQGPPPA